MHTHGLSEGVSFGHVSDILLFELRVQMGLTDLRPYIMFTCNLKHLCSHVGGGSSCYLSTTKLISILEFFSKESRSG